MEDSRILHPFGTLSPDESLRGVPRCGTGLRATRPDSQGNRPSLRSLTWSTGLGQAPGVGFRPDLPTSFCPSRCPCLTSASSRPLSDRPPALTDLVPPGHSQGPRPADGGSARSAQGEVSREGSVRAFRLGSFCRGGRRPSPVASSEDSPQTLNPLPH